MMAKFMLMWEGFRTQLGGNNLLGSRYGEKAHLRDSR